MTIPSVSFPFRLIFDSAFYEDVLKGSLRSKNISPPLTTRLAILNDRAKGCSRTFNTMSAKVFQDIIKKGMPRSGLRAMFMPVDQPEIEQIENEVERTIKHAINLASTEQPNLVMIMTSDAKKEEYVTNKHYNSTTLVVISSGEECLKIINDFYASVERTD